MALPLLALVLSMPNIPLVRCCSEEVRSSKKPHYCLPDAHRNILLDRTRPTSTAATMQGTGNRLGAGAKFKPFGRIGCCATVNCLDDKLITHLSSCVIERFLLPIVLSIFCFNLLRHSFISCADLSQSFLHTWSKRLHRQIP